ncbi:MAG: hypothetical protein PUD33_08010 [Treponema sp.]|nr:hypothetical protein [Treponema sp.]
MEKYLDHVVGSSVERIYDRQDYFEERQKIQCVYSYFLSTCYGDKNIIAEAKKSIVEYNSNVDDKNNIIVIDETWEK